MEKNPMKEIVSEEALNNSINAVKKTSAEQSEQVANINLNPEKVVSVLESLRGETVSTVVSVIAAAVLPLPVEAIMAVRQAVGSALKMSMMSNIASMLGELKERMDAEDKEKEDKKED